MEEFRKEFEKINEDPGIDGILLLRPLPPQLDEKEIERLIDPAKDLDGISPENIAKVFSGDETGFAPCTAEAVIRMLKGYEIPIEGKRAVIVGRSMVVGRPLAMLLLKENATVTPHQDEKPGGSLPPGGDPGGRRRAGRYDHRRFSGRGGCGGGRGH